MNRYLKNYYNTIEELTKHFCNKYFKGVYEYDVNDWVDIGGVICINDYLFSLNDIEYAIKYNATKKELFEFYDFNLERQIKNLKNMNKQNSISFFSYLKYFRGLNFKEIEKIIDKKNDI